MQAVIYTRVSLDRSNGRSVEDQERECRAECERRGWPIRAVFSDNSISASRYGKARPEWEKVKRALKADDVLVMWEASRAQRDLEEWVRLRNICADLGVLVSYSGRVLDLNKGDDRFTGGLDALLAERESEIFRERVLRGKRSGLAEGRPAGRLKWGYQVVAPGVWELDPIEAPKVKESIERMLRGDSIRSILRWLWEQPGYQPPTITVLQRALVSPTYAGLRTHRGQVVGKGVWPAIITEEQYQQLLARSRRKKIGPVASPEPKHLLSGLIQCGKEGCNDVVRYRARSKAESETRRPIYACVRGHCSRVADAVDALVLERLFEWLSEVDPRKFDTSRDAEIEAIWAEVDQLNGQLSEWREMALKGEVTPQSFAMFEQGLTKRIAELEEKAEPADFTSMNPATIHANWKSMDMRDKRAVIKGFFDITMYPAERGHKVGTSGVEVTPKIS